MISLPIWIRHLGVLTYEDSACTDENDSGDGDQLSEFISFLSQDWFLNRFPRTALKTERYFCCSEVRQAIQ